jgi:Trypsin-like serine proteases, typically periplasmic, contain C-terminal PDZ domain
MRVGEWVIAIGNPYRLEHTVTVGVLSAKGREIQVADQEQQRTRTYRNLMQTDAAINPGNSGGPLLNLRGEAIGINTAVRADAQGIGFAIPINEAKAVLKDLVERGMVVRPFIGISYDTVDQAWVRQLNLAVDRGIIILDVIPGTAAERAGLRVRDVVIEVNGRAVNDSSDFLEAIDGMEVGDVLIFTVVRDGREVVLRVEVGERPPGV